ncbi:hypothetical protein [Halorhodospira sp. 9628]|uniref:hypothetical protein n=1 Tax=Halorhodospira sp. 9628 TaxID=2899137 RepID=UPI001EE87CCB|nr:hypothetical protein [Halorhodospira sp. 9628]MCG5529237.1 hypothetical protein [Halorhodospira halophila]MCG5543086.1 hypothetical protein [Halorhodospira sp. 9628]MCG5543093.1 hypothetical protein [Halorhodospira sp. 9628]
MEMVIVFALGAVIFTVAWFAVRIFKSMTGGDPKTTAVGFLVQDLSNYGIDTKKYRESSSRTMRSGLFG